MLSYFLKLFITLVFSFLVIFYYYIGFSFHLESYDGPGFMYFFFVGIAYILYKSLTVQFGGEKLRFNVFHILGLFLLHLFIVCVFHFTALEAGANAPAITLFLKVLYFSLLPILCIVLSFSFGNTVLEKILHIHKENMYFEYIVSTGFGLAAFIFLLSIAGFFSFYSVVTVFGILGVFAVVGYKRNLSLFSRLKKMHFETENHDVSTDGFARKFQPFLLSVELLFIISTFLLSVNLINVVRPFPIGWDDLGVYMNFARQIALAGEVLPLGQMVSWQMFTGLGFLFGSTTQAFFLNTFSGVLSFLAIIAFISYILPRRTSFPIPLLLGTIYLALPMVIFHLAKDMKLDQGLLFFNITTLFIVYYVYIQDELSFKKKLLYILLAGFLAGFSFSIKLTALLIITSIFGLIFFQFLGILGFFSFASLYVAFFTKLRLWDFLNVAYPKDMPEMLDTFSLTLGIIGITLFFVAFYLHKHHIKKFFAHILMYTIGIVIALTPWLIFNYSTIDVSDKFSVLNIVNGKNKIFVPEYQKIHSSEFIKNIEIQKSMTHSGVSTNEDLGRYFGYETGLNNYVKLPWNLTMQENQKGEFTDITYIFLALLPGVLLFLPYKNFLYTIPIYIWMLMILAMHVFLPTKEFFTLTFSIFDMPLGYAILALGFLFFLLPLFYGIKKHTSLHSVFRLNIIFGLSYCFLWAISSFGIVWYGIAMLMFLLILLAIGMFYISDTHNDSFYEKSLKNFGAFCIFFISIFYFFQSSIVHGMTNLKNAGSIPYKMGMLNEDESVFVAHPEYLTILYNININSSKQKDFLEGYKREVKEVFDKYEGNVKVRQFIQEIDSIQVLTTIMSEFIHSKEVNNIPLQRDLRKVLNKIYTDILIPSKDLKSDAKIYRIGTFLKYYITENNARLYEDSLLFQFKRYFSVTGKESPDEIIGNIKKLGMDFLLVDLNAATIDDDPQKKLTQRYEDLLMALTSSKLEILSNDSACFRAGLETYRGSAKTEKDTQFYLLMAGVNYDSQINGNEYTKSKKLFGCYKYLHELYKQGKISQESFSFLMPLKDALDGVEIENDEQMIRVFRNLVNTGYKAIFKINQ